MIAHMDEDTYEQEGTLLSRSELVNNLFGDVGKLIDCKFNCVHTGNYLYSTVFCLTACVDSLIIL